MMPGTSRDRRWRFEEAALPVPLPEGAWVTGVDALGRLLLEGPQAAEAAASLGPSMVALRFPRQGRQES